MSYLERIVRWPLNLTAIAINKPRGSSSAQVVRDCQLAFNPSTFFKPLIQADINKRVESSGGKVRRSKIDKRGNRVKIGHGGTLDPLATGVLILGIGSATKSLLQFLDCAKTYETVVLFGAATDTYDRVGRILTRRPYDHITREKVEKELEHFRGKRTQIPPLYSALKMNGKPLYEYAREGKPIPREIQGREVTALEVEIIEWYEPKSHNFRWPTEEAEAAERSLAEQVWNVKKQQESSKKLTPEEKEEDNQAFLAHETFKQKFEERQDELIRDSPSNKRDRHSKEPPMMSGALGQMPQPNYAPNRGRNLVPDAPDENTPPPWTDDGPPAVKIRLSVSSGYYVRSFCHDLGAKLGSAGLMAELCRESQSDFTVGGLNCLEFEDLAKGEEVWGPKVANMLARWNGEPEGFWPGKASSNSGQASPPNNKNEQKSRSPKAGSSNPHKRPRSPSAERTSPGKAAMTSPDKKLKTSGRGRSDDEKSWNGIED